jgi:hypothetical protein
MRNRLICCAAALLAWGCSDGGGSTPPPVATSVSVTPGTVSLDAVGATQVVRASVLDQSGKAMPGASLTWSSSSAAVTVTAAGGDSAVVRAVGNGSATISAAAGSASGTMTAQVAQVAASVQKVAGDAQSANAGTAVATPLRAGVRDRLGAPVAGVTLTFTAIAGGGAVTASSAVTGADGNATVGWTLGTEAGTAQRVRVIAVGVGNAEFSAEATVGPPATAVATAGNGQTTVPGGAVAVLPRVMVRDAFGNAVTGVTVQFTVTAGGGSVTGATRTTTSGIAEVGSWTLGAAGVNTLTASFPGTAVPPVVFTATAAAVGTLVISAGQNQGAMVGTAVPDAPVVTVRNGAGNPLPGLTVTFAVTAGGGTVGSATAVTNASGMASPGSWTLGAAGPNTLRASVAGLAAAAVEFRGIGCEGGGAGYKLTLCYTTPMTSSQRAVFQNAAARWASVITGDLQDLSGSVPADVCGDDSPALDMTFDDLLIFAGIENIDGPGAVLGQAGWCGRRTAGLPFLGLMRFDAADVATLEANGQFGSVILHEMGHVLGIGTLWSAFGLLQNPSTAGNPVDTYFSGSNAIQGFNMIGGIPYTGGQKVPVENTGGAGTMNGHWRESVLGRELMTGYLNSGSNPLSHLTKNSLVDLGYTVGVGGTDDFTIATSLRAGPDGPALKLHNDIYSGPRFTMDRQGRRTPIR